MVNIIYAFLINNMITWYIIILNYFTDQELPIHPNNEMEIDSNEVLNEEANNSDDVTNEEISSSVKPDDNEALSEK